MAAISILLSTGMALSAKTQFKVSLDSAYIMMGRTTGLHLQILDTSGNAGNIVIPRDSFPKEVEFAQETLPDLKIDRLANGSAELTATYILQSFDSGSYRLPPLMYVNGADTTLSNRVTLKVVPVDVSELADINPVNSPVDLPSKWYDWIPDFITDYWLYILIGVIIIAGGICAYLMSKKNIVSRLIPAKKVEPPYEVAIRKLTLLKEAQLWENGQEKSFYTDLTNILREYLDKRFGINAMEMTSSQIMNAIRSNEETRMSDSLMAQVLEIADFVKFAKVTPLREENLRSFDSALRFVEATKPVPVEKPDDQKETNPKTTDSNTK